MFLEIRGIKKSFGTGDSRVNVLKGLDLDIVSCLDHPVRVNQHF